MPRNSTPNILIDSSYGAAYYAIMNNFGNQPQQPEKRKVFISFHHKDELYRNEFNRLWGDQFIGTDVKLGDIPIESDVDYIKRLIQVDHIFNSSVVVALYGAETRKRKHVDWEISAAVSEKVGGRKGLVVMIIPGFPVSPYNEFGVYDQSRLYPHLHPRTAENLKTGYADVYFWPGMYPQMTINVQVKDLLEIATKKRDTHKDKAHTANPQYVNNIP